MTIAKRKHLYPCRTQKLRSLALMILGGRLPGKVERCRNKIRERISDFGIFLVSSVGRANFRLYIRRNVPESEYLNNLIYSSLAQSVERMTVNHDVAGIKPNTRSKKRIP